jgi:hypothetical protein
MEGVDELCSADELRNSAKLRKISLSLAECTLGVRVTMIIKKLGVRADTFILSVFYGIGLLPLQRFSLASEKYNLLSKLFQYQLFHNTLNRKSRKYRD